MGVSRIELEESMAQTPQEGAASGRVFRDKAT